MLEINGESEKVNTVEPSLELPPGAALFTIFLCMLFGANAVAIKISLAGIGVFTAAGLRFGCSAIIIFSWIRLTGRVMRIDGCRVKKLVVATMLFVVQVTLFYCGLKRTTASHGVLIANLLPFVVLILAHFYIPGDGITGKKIIGVLLGFMGVLLLVFDKQGISADIEIGDMIILGAVCVWGVSAVYVKTLTRTIHPVLITFYPMIFATPVFLTAGFFLDREMVVFIDGPVLFSMLYQSLVTASFGYIAWNTLIKKYGTTSVHSFIYIMPVSGVFFGVILLDEPVTPNIVGAIILIVIGILVVNRKSGR